MRPENGPNGHHGDFIEIMCSQWYMKGLDYCLKRLLMFLSFVGQSSTGHVWYIFPCTSYESSRVSSDIAPSDMSGMYFLLQSVQVQAMYNIIQKLTKLNENDGFSYNSAYFDGVQGGNFSDVDKNMS